jgi:hypothetical protein
MVTRKNNAVAFIAILITAWLVVHVTQVEAQTTEEQKQALIGEWTGVWPSRYSNTATLIIHEIDTAKAKAQCTYTSDSETGGKKKPVLADFTPGPNPKIEFKLEGNDYKFILKNKVLQATFKGMMGGHYVSNNTSMERKPKK